jgi:hypothetical protein
VPGHLFSSSIYIKERIPMNTGPFSINGKTFTRVLNASEHVGRLIADIDGLLHTERDPAAMTNLLDERAVLYTARETLVGSMCAACETEKPEQPAPKSKVMLGCDFLALDALLEELDAKVPTATGNDLSALNFRRDALSRVIGVLRGAARSQSDTAAESLLPTHEDLEGEVNIAVDASEACEHCSEGDTDYTPEFEYEEACLERVRRTVFRMAGLVPNMKSAADADKIDWAILGPAAVQLDDNLIVAWPLDGAENYPRSAEIGGVLVIPNRHVVPKD